MYRYIELLEKFTNVCEEAGKSIDFIFVHHDCEQAIINAVKKVFPNACSRLCRFHVIDSIRRHADRLGLRKLLKTRPDLRRFYARIRQIFFFNTTLWPRVWEVLLGELSEETKEIELVQEFLNYLVSSPIFCLMKKVK